MILSFEKKARAVIPSVDGITHPYKIIDMTNLYRLRGMIPNRYWYQLNGQSAQVNWLEQREAIYSRIQEQEEKVVPQIIFTSEVKIK